MKRKSVKVAAISGAYLRKVAASMCSRMLRNNRPSVKQQKQIDGYLVRGERKGDIARGEVVDLPGFLAFAGRNTGTLMPRWQSGLCKMLAQGRDVFLLADAVPSLHLFQGYTVIAPCVWSGTPPTDSTLSMTWCARPAPRAGACVTTTAIEVDRLADQPFAHGSGRVWLLVGYANPTRTRDAYNIENNEAELLETVRGAPAIGICLELSAMLAPHGAVAHPPRPAGGWSDILAGGEAAIAWAFATPYPSGTRHPNFWATVQVTKQQSSSDYRGRRCLLILRVTGMTDTGEYGLMFWLVDPGTTYPGRAGYGYNYHLPSAPVVLSDGSLVLFDPYQAHMADEGVCRYTLGLFRVTAGGSTASILHTSDIDLGEPPTNATLGQYHFEGADVSEGDVVIGMCFGYEFSAAPTVTVYRIEGGSVTSVTLETEGFVRCLYRFMACHGGFFSDYLGHWAISLPPSLHRLTGVSAGADKVTYIGNGKWAVYVSTDPQTEAAGISGSLAVAIYDDATRTISLAGIVYPYSSVSAGATARLGRMDCVVKEKADENGTVIRKATLIATYGGDTWYPGNSGLGSGATCISHDSGATWAELIDYGGSPGGVVYCGNAMEPRTEPISRGLR